MGHLILTLDPQGCSRSPRGTPRGQGHTIFFTKSTNVTNRCCHICIINDKNVFDVITRPPQPTGPLRRTQKGPGGHTKSQSNEKMLLLNFVAHASVMTKTHLGSPLPPYGGNLGTQGASRGYTNSQSYEKCY